MLDDLSLSFVLPKIPLFVRSCNTNTHRMSCERTIELSRTRFLQFHSHIRNYWFLHSELRPSVFRAAKKMTRPRWRVEMNSENWPCGVVLNFKNAFFWQKNLFPKMMHLYCTFEVIQSEYFIKNEKNLKKSYKNSRNCEREFSCFLQFHSHIRTLPPTFIVVTERCGEFCDERSHWSIWWFCRFEYGVMNPLLQRVLSWQIDI